MAVIQSGASATQWTIDTTSDAGRVTFYDTNGNPMSNVSSLGNVLNALNAAVSITLGGQSTAGINISGTTGTLTLSFEATIDNTNWFAITATPLPSGATATSTSANGQWVIDLGGFYAVRTRISAFTSGSMTVSVVVSPNNSKNISQAVTFTGGVSQGAPNTIANSWPVEVTDGTNVLGTPTHPVRTDPTGTTTQPVSISGTVPVSGTITANQGTAAALSGHWPVQVTDGTNVMPTGDAVGRAIFEKITDGTNTATVTASSALKVDGSAVTQPVSGTVTAAQATAANLNATVTQGPANTTANAWPTKVTDGTNTAAVKASTTAAATTDPALVVALSPNSPTPLMADSNSSGTLVTNNSTLAITTNGQSSLTVNITGTWSAVINFQATTDGTNWFNIQGFNTTNFSLPVAAATQATTSVNGTFTFDVGGYKQFRLLMTPYTSGTAAVAFNSGQGINESGLLSVIAANTGAQATDFTNTGTITALNGTVSITGQGVYTVTASVTGTWSATLVAEGQLADSTWVIIPMYVLSSSVLPYTSTFSTTTNGTFIITGGGFLNVRLRASTFTSGTVNVAFDGSLSQQTVFTSQLGTWAMAVPCVPSARTVKIYEATAAAVSTTEAMLTLTPLTNFTAGSTGTSFTVTSGKVFRIQSFAVSIRSAATTAAAGVAKLRVSSSGAVTTATNLAFAVGTGATNALAGGGSGGAWGIPDGLELSGTMQFGVSAIGAPNTALWDVSIIGFEY